MTVITLPLLLNLRYVSPACALETAQIAEPIVPTGSVMWQINTHIARYAPTLDGTTARHYVSGDAVGPSNIRGLMDALGVHIMTAMATDAAWRGLGVPVSQHVLVAAEFGEEDNAATYYIDEETERAGRAEYERLLAAFFDAERRGWPTWKDYGIMELPPLSSS